MDKLFGLRLLAAILALAPATVYTAAASVNGTSVSARVAD